MQNQPVNMSSVNIQKTPPLNGDKTAALVVSDLGVRLQARPVLHHINLHVASACWTSIVGPNGAGKSTLLRALVGLVPYSGHIELLGRPWSGWSRRQRAQAVAWLGQNEVPTDDLTVYDVALLGRMPYQSWLSPPQQQDHVAAQKALQSTGAWDWRERTLAQLSGGERQRVLLARALAVEAKVLLMDEPIAHLDPPHQADWLELVRSLVAKGTTVVSVLHEVSVALQADHVVVMAGGRIQHHGHTGDKTTHHAIEHVFDQRIAIAQASGRWLAVLQA
jgi:iron complex transport system ATP-binding protein